MEHRAGWLDPVFKALSAIGTDGAIWLVLGLALVLLLRRPQIFLLLATADLLGQLSAYGLKEAVGRRRPHLDPLVAVPHSPSFPSGHAASSFACAAALAWAAPRLAIPAFALAAAIAYSRVYLGVHYPLDVIGGAVLGLAVATALRLLVAGRPRLPRARPGG